MLYTKSLIFSHFLYFKFLTPLFLSFVWPVVSGATLSRQVPHLSYLSMFIIYVFMGPITFFSFISFFFFSKITKGVSHQCATMVWAISKAHIHSHNKTILQWTLEYDKATVFQLIQSWLAFEFVQVFKKVAGLWFNREIHGLTMNG